MSWFFAVVVLVGLGLGANFRAPALLAASAIVAVACAVTAWIAGHAGLRLAGLVVAALAALQVSYLVGVVIVQALRSREPADDGNGDATGTHRKGDDTRDPAVDRAGGRH